MAILLAVLSTLFREAILATLVLWLLPQIGIRLPLWLMVIIFASPVAWGIVTYRPVRHVLREKTTTPTEELVGMKGIALTRLDPKGLVRIHGEIWEAIASNGVIEAGSEVIVLQTEGLEITVSKVERQR